METNEMPLDLDLNSVDTSFPLIANGEIVDLQVEKIEKKATSKGGQMLSIEFKTVTPTRSVKGDDMQPGVKVFHNINLVPTGKATAQMVIQNIAAFTQGIGFVGNLQEFMDGWPSLQGGQVRAKIAFVPEGPDKTGVVRRAKNEVSSFIKK